MSRDAKASPELTLVVGDGQSQVPLAAEPLSLEALYRAHAKAVARVGLRLLGRRSEADDLVQDVFIQAHRGLAGLEHPEAARAWLCTIAVRLAMRRLKRRSRNPFFRPANLDALPEPQAGGISPDDRAELSTLYRVLDTLSPDRRVAWVLRHVEERTLPQVAQLCGCSLATAKRRIAAAQKTIAEAFDEPS